MMNFKTTLKTLLIITISSASVALSKSDVVAEKVLTNSKTGEKITVTTRETGLVVGRPFTLEVKASCANKSADSKKSVETMNVCDVKTKSARLSADNKTLFITIRDTDSDAYNDLTLAADAESLKSVKPTCKVSSREIAIDLSEACAQ